MFLYPFMIAPLFIEDEQNQKAVQYAIDNNKLLTVAISMEGYEGKNDIQHIYNVGIAGNIMRKVSLPDGKIKVLFQGLAKVRIKEAVSSDPNMVLVDNLEVVEEDFAQKRM